MADQATTDALIATALAAQAIKTARQALARAPVPGPVGPRGGQGPQGNTGPAGADGGTGAAGPQGGTGPAGLQGPQGDRGATGAVGPQGLAGEIGERGLAGADGRDGIDGEPGPRGERGQAGHDTSQLPRAEWSATFTRDGTARTERITLTSPAADRRPRQITPICDDTGLVTAAQILPID